MVVVVVPFIHHRRLSMPMHSMRAYSISWAAILLVFYFISVIMLKKDYAYVITDGLLAFGFMSLLGLIAEGFTRVLDRLPDSKKEKAAEESTAQHYEDDEEESDS